MSKNIAITAAGSLQHIATNVSTRLEALNDFDAKVGTNPHGKELHELADEFEFYVLDDKQVDQLNADDKAFNEMNTPRLDPLL